MASLAFSFVLIPTSGNDVWLWHLYIGDPVRRNRSVLFTCRVALSRPLHSKVLTRAHLFGWDVLFQ